MYQPGDALHAVTMYATGMDHSVIEGMQLESLTDVARVSGLVPTDVTEVFDGTVDEARENSDVFEHLPDFLQRRDMDPRTTPKLRVSLYRSSTARPEDN